ncbi:MAG TPA: alkaline phosphatase family protein [Gammaproteobacteria bacterium]|jgi:acid phosphatase
MSMSKSCRVLACVGLASLSLTAVAAKLPRAQHVVLVIEENRSLVNMHGAAEVPYLNQLAGEGALLTNYYAIMHPSEPNYVALFSGDTQGVKDDSCPHAYQKPNLADALAAKKVSFAIYSENLPSVGFAGCGSDDKLYRRKHNPVPDFTTVPADDNRPFSDFPSDYSKLPAVSFVVPNMMDDMHDGTPAQADAWLKDKLEGYKQWAMQNHSLLIITFDEDDGADNNRVMTIVLGQDVKPGKYDQKLNHYDLLRMLTDMYGAAPVAAAAQAKGIGDIWK